MMIVCFILAIFLFFTLYIYVMRQSENIVYAIKESIAISKANIVMVILTIIVYMVLSCLGITQPLGEVFAVYMLKELKPDIKDES